jgi:NADH:ubiquinone oxidoreductase subunit K
MVLTIGASESSIGLAIIIIYYRLRGGISIELISLLKG